MLGLRWEREQAERYQDPAAFSISDPFGKNNILTKEEFFSLSPLCINRRCY